MRSNASDGLTDKDREIIRAALDAHPNVSRAVLFGSRAMGSFSRGSDIDLALEGDSLDQGELSRIASKLEDSRLPFKVDLLLTSITTYKPLLEHIREKGQVFFIKQS